MRTETTKVQYGTSLRDGIREADAQGHIYDDGPDEPFIIVVQRETVTDVRDGRGKNREASDTQREDVLRLTPVQASELVQSLVSDLSYIIEVTERRVLVPEPQEN